MTLPGAFSTPAANSKPSIKSQSTAKPQPTAKPQTAAKSKPTTKSKFAAESYHIETLKSDLLCPAKSGVFHNFCFMKFSHICTASVVVTMRPCSRAP